MSESPPPVSLDDQISCVLREITERRRLYPIWVLHRTMSQHRADTELREMEAVLVTLSELHAMLLDSIAALG